jgi:O-antigen/teichoic acid export membrane protein
MNKFQLYLDKIKARFQHGSAIKNIAILTLGTVIAQVMTVGATPVLSRLFMPAEFGLLAVFMAITAVVATFVTFRYEANILIPKADSEAVQLVFFSIATAMVLGACILITIWIFPSLFGRLLSNQGIKAWLPWACLIGIIAAISTTLFGWLNRGQLYSVIAKFRILQSLVFSVAAILLGIWEFESGLLIAQIMSLLVVMLLIIRYFPLSKWSGMTSMLTVGRKYGHAVKYMLPTALLDVITLQIPIILIGLWYGSSEAGQFSLAWRVLVLPCSLIGVAIGQVFYQRFSVVWPDAQAAWSLLVKAWIALALIGIIPMILIMAAGEDIFSLIFGSNWVESGKMASILAPMLFASLLHSPTSTTSLVLGLQRKVFFLSLAILIYRPLSLYIGWKLGDIYIGLIIFSIFEIIQITIFQSMVYKKINPKLTF